jgi:hypothetical protein
MSTTEHMTLKVGDRVRPLGRGEDAGTWEVTQAYPSSPYVVLRSERSGREQTFIKSALRGAFEVAA